MMGEAKKVRKIIYALAQFKIDGARILLPCTCSFIYKQEDKFC